MSPVHPTTPFPPEHAFLLRVASLLNAYGTPAHRLERELLALAKGLHVTAAFHSTPTGVLASFGSGDNERVHLVRVEPGEIDLGRLLDFDEVIEAVRVGQMTVLQGLDLLEAVEQRAPRYPFLVVALSFAAASAGAAALFGGHSGEVLVSALLGSLIFVLARVLRKHSSGAGTLEPLGAFVAAFVSFMCAEKGLLGDHRLATLASLIVLVPGLTLTLALVELSTGHLVSGVARLARAGVVFLTILLGVALAWGVGNNLWPADPSPVVPTLSDAHRYFGWFAIVCTPVAFAVIFAIRKREWPAVLATSWLGFAAATHGTATLDERVGPFLGALTIGIASNLYARFRNKPALVLQIPGILFLVPGSLGYSALTEFLVTTPADVLDGAVASGKEMAQQVKAIEKVFSTALVAGSLVGGLLAANLVLPPRREL
jgi:uncharacterized membrane protein YjjP (DUF1212 family)